MSSPTLQHSIEIRHGHLAGLLILVAALSGATTWFASNVHDSATAVAARPKAVVSSRAANVDSVPELTPGQRAAIYANVSSQQRAKDIAALSVDQLAAIYGNVPRSAAP